MLEYEYIPLDHLERVFFHLYTMNVILTCQLLRLIHLYLHCICLQLDERIYRAHVRRILTDQV